MALDFPNSPSLNDTVELGGKTYQWDGVKWRMVYVITPTPPTPSTAAPTITIVTEAGDGVTFTLTNNDDNTALISYEVDDNIGGVELAAAATSSNITVALSAGTYTLSAFATVVGEVATQSTQAVEIIVIPMYELLYSETVATAKTQIDITGLSIGKDDGLRLVYTFVKTSGSANIYLYANDDNTLTNYWFQNLEGAGSTTYAERANQARMAISIVDKSSGFADIKVSNNDRFVVKSQYLGRPGASSSSMFIHNYNMIGTGTVSSITKLSFVASATDGIGVGSKIALYKVTEAA